MYENAQNIAYWADAQSAHSNLAAKSLSQFEQHLQDARTPLAEQDIWKQQLAGVLEQQGIGIGSSSGLTNAKRAGVLGAANRVGLKGQAAILRERSEILVKHIVDLSRQLFEPTVAAGNSQIIPKDNPDSVEGDLRQAIRNLDEAMAGAENILSQIGGR